MNETIKTRLNLNIGLFLFRLSINSAVTDKNIVIRSHTKIRKTNFSLTKLKNWSWKKKKTKIIKAATY